MAKPLGEKSKIIRTAIVGNPDKGNKAIAEMLNDSQDRLDDKLTFKDSDIAQQRQALKKLEEGKAASPTPAPAPVAAPAPTPAPASEPAPKRRGRKPGSKNKTARKPAATTAPALAAAAPTAPAPAAESGLSDDLATIKRLVQKLGAQQVSQIAQLFE